MSKRKLTQNQSRRIAESQQNRLGGQEGLLLARYGANAIVANEDWRIMTCNFRQNLPAPVPGDRVIWQEEKGDTGVITAIMPRQTILTKANPRGDNKPIAANVTQMIITLAPEPAPSVELVDRYLIAASNLGFKVVIVVNKSDLANLPDLSIYQDLDFTVLNTSVHEASSLVKLCESLTDETSIFVGQSGVGKSSLINELIPECDIRVGEISEASKLGKHTTTTTMLYRVPSGGYLIDSPGVRQFRLWQATKDEILQGYAEIADAAQTCQFRDCAHKQEPNCSVQAAVKSGDIHPQRWENFQRICLDP